MDAPVYSTFEELLVRGLVFRIARFLNVALVGFCTFCGSRRRRLRSRGWRVELSLW